MKTDVLNVALTNMNDGRMQTDHAQVTSSPACHSELEK